MTLGQLLSKRDEFWDTAPAFNGRQEIWQALRAAAECEDTDTAQAIMSAVDVTYVLCAPIHATHGALTILSTLVAWFFYFHPYSHATAHDRAAYRRHSHTLHDARTVATHNSCS